MQKAVDATRGRERERKGEGGISCCGIGSLGYLGNHIKVWVGWLPAVRNPPIVASASGQWDLFRPRRGRPWRSLPDRITPPGAMKMPLHWMFAEEAANWEKTLSVTMDRSSIVGCSIIFFSPHCHSSWWISWIVGGNSMILNDTNDRIMIMERRVYIVYILLQIFPIKKINEKNGASVSYFENNLNFNRIFLDERRKIWIGE